MLRAILETVVVQSDGQVVVRSPELPPPGTPTEVVVMFEEHPSKAVPTPLTRLMGALRGVYGSQEEADAYLNQERDSWES
ncbi:MAG: hypothetical protein HYU36_01980 [Planctomycetes bacterium]|nr:hypothetical protein [Planctomycetota bacterium]